MSAALRALALASAACLLLACASMPVPLVQRPGGEQALQSWARVLDGCVNERGQVDFRALADRPDELDRYVAYVADFDAASLPTPTERLAYQLNAYNGMAMYAVLATKVPRTNAGLGKIRFFYFRRYRIGGVTQSLFTYEKGIRAQGDPRVHFALNCMSVSCPRLPRAPFTAAGLDAELDREARFFFSEPRNLEVDAAAHSVRVSSILKFYRAEFEARAGGSLIAFINRYAPQQIPADYRVDFIPYDWTINASARP